MGLVSGRGSRRAVALEGLEQPEDRRRRLIRSDEEAWNSSLTSFRRVRDRERRSSPNPQARQCYLARSRDQNGRHCLASPLPRHKRWNVAERLPEDWSRLSHG